MVADLHLAHTGTDFLDDASRLVAEQHRQRARTVVVHHGQVRVADAGRGDLDQDFTFARRGELKLADGNRLRIRVGTRGIRALEHSALDGDGVRHVDSFEVV